MPLCHLTAGTWSIKGEPGPGSSGFPAYLWVTDLNGNNKRQLTGGDPPVHEGAAYSPDGNTIAFYCTDFSAAAYELRLIPANGGSPRTVLRKDSGYGRQSGLAWSPDGREIVFSSGHGPGAEPNLYVVAVGDAEERVRKLTDAGGSDTTCNWR